MEKQKSLNRGILKVIYPMNKRGQIIEISVAILMLLIALYGTYYTFQEGSKIYIGDSKTSSVYDYSQCKTLVDNIPDSQKVLFKSLDEAKNNKYTLKGCE